MARSQTELKVTEQDAGLRLDQFLAAPLGSRTQAQSAIESGRVQVNGEPRPKRHIVQAGEVVAVEEGELPGPDVPNSAGPVHRRLRG